MFSLIIMSWNMRINSILQRELKRIEFRVMKKLNELLCEHQCLATKSQLQEFFWLTIMQMIDNNLKWTENLLQAVHDNFSCSNGVFPETTRNPLTRGQVKIYVISSEIYRILIEFFTRAMQILYGKSLQSLTISRVIPNTGNPTLFTRGIRLTRPGLIFRRCPPLAIASSRKSRVECHDFSQLFAYHRFECESLQRWREGNYLICRSRSHSAPKQ